jgi:hypothetical protein
MVLGQYPCNHVSEMKKRLAPCQAMLHLLVSCTLAAIQAWRCNTLVLITELEMNICIYDEWQSVKVLLIQRAVTVLLYYYNDLAH